MSESGILIYPGTIRFERALPASPARIWEYLTVPALLKLWLAETTIEVCVGGEVEHRFDVKEAPERKKGGDIICGVITRCVPRQLLGYSWGDSAVAFELKADNKEVRLVLTHSGLSEPLIAKCCAGWHAHLDILLAHLSEEKPEAFRPLFEKLFKHYKIHAPKIMKNERRKLSANGQRHDRRRSPRGSDFV